MTGVRSQKSGVRSQKSEVRRQRAEDRGRPIVRIGSFLLTERSSDGFES